MGVFWVSGSQGFRALRAEGVRNTLFCTVVFRKFNEKVRFFKLCVSEIGSPCLWSLALAQYVRAVRSLEYTAVTPPERIA